MLLTDAFRILVVTRAALIAGSTGEIGEARALARGVAANGGRTNGAAVARFAVGIAVVSRYALVASNASISFLAQANTVLLVAYAGLRAARVAVAIYELHRDHIQRGS